VYLTPKGEDKMRLKPSFRVNIIFLLAVFFGLAAAWGVYSYLLDIKEEYRTAGEFTTVVVAAEHIPRGTKIERGAVAVKEIPARYIHQSAVADPANVIGKITTGEIFPGEQIIKDRFYEEGETKHGLAYLLAEGERAATVAVDKVSGIAGLIKPGNRVDVLATVRHEDKVLTTVVVQNVKVLAVNRVLDGEGTRQSSEGAYPETITLALTPLQMQKVILASEQGSIRLALRSPPDNAILDIPSVKLEDVVK